MGLGECGFDAGALVGADFVPTGLGAGDLAAIGLAGADFVADAFAELFLAAVDFAEEPLAKAGADWGLVGLALVLGFIALGVVLEGACLSDFLPAAADFPPVDFGVFFATAKAISCVTRVQVFTTPAGWLDSAALRGEHDSGVDKALSNTMLCLFFVSRRRLVCRELGFWRAVGHGGRACFFGSESPMKISLEWLREYLPEVGGASVCGEALTMAGLPTENFETLGNDTVMDVEVTSNRGDCLSHLGVARELGALLGHAVREPAGGRKVGVAGAVDGWRLVVEDATLCPLYTARVIRGVKVGPSPAWLARRLEAVGVRPVNNIVDVTNYVLFELGQPLHAFDAGRLSGGTISVRRARAGETINTLDGHVRKLSGEMLVVADGDKPVALAGLMGGKESEVTEATTDILLESAIFDPLAVRRMSRALQLRTDGSHRFERGIPTDLPEAASARAADLIMQLAGGIGSADLGVVGELQRKARTVSLRMASLKRTLGIDVATGTAVDALARLRFAPKVDGETIIVTVPGDRLDVSSEIDLVEEVTRMIGYEQIPMKQSVSIVLAPPQRPQVVMEKVRTVLTGSGYFEAITFSFVADGVRGAFLPPGAAGLPRALHGVRKADGHLRPSCLPGLMEAQRRNEAAGTRDVRLFEVGSTFVLSEKAEIEETRKLAILSTDEPRKLRGIIEQLFAVIDSAVSVSFTPVQRKGYFRAVEVAFGGNVVGVMGVADTALAAKMDLRVQPSVAEIDVLPLIDSARLVPQLSPLPRFPAVDRDLSLVVEESIRYAQIESLVAELQMANLEACQFVTTYRGKPLDKGKKSVTVKLVFRKPDGTLTAEDADGAIQAVVTKAATSLGATLRA